MHSDQTQQNAFQNPQQQTAYLQQLAQAVLQQAHHQSGAGFGQGWIGQSVYGQGGYGLGGPSQYNLGFGMGGPQRQLTQHDVSSILQQIAPILPQIIAQAQQQQTMPQAAFGGGFGLQQRTLSPQDVNEVVRQILPVIPQLLQSAQGQSWQGGFGQTGFGQTGGFGQWGQGWGQAAYGPSQQDNPFGRNPARQLSPQDVNEVVRQLAEILPQAIAGQQVGQQRLF
jgi:hypothetical protein